ncbi:MAG: hypothetical protein ACRYGI_14240 [Janthinobacterium lividum]
MQHRSTSFDRLMIAGFALLGFLLLEPVLTIPLHVPVNYNEGWNAGFDTRAVSLVFDNYPPLGFFIVGAAGRIVSLVALLAAAGFMGLSIRQLGGTARSATAASLLLMLYACSFYRTYVVMDDPQWLAHAMMLAGLVLLLRDGAIIRHESGSLSSRLIIRIAASSLPMVAGGFVEHNLVALGCRSPCG